jgi:hypothetical protein
MAKQQRMFTVILVCLYGALAPHAWQPNLHTHGWSVPVAALLLIIIGCVITALRRLRRAAATLASRGTTGGEHAP